jgi:hypothetical protein
MMATVFLAAVGTVISVRSSKLLFPDRLNGLYKGVGLARPALIHRMKSRRSFTRPVGSKRAGGGLGAII